MSLDVFSPSLAPLVGQDFVFMGDYAKWVKPMIYRFGNGPSSLRSEIPALINELGAYLALEENEVLDWVGSQIKELRNLSLKQIEKSVTLNFMQTEIRKAVHLFSETPVFAGEFDIQALTGTPFSRQYDRETGLMLWSNDI